MATSTELVSSQAFTLQQLGEAFTNKDTLDFAENTVLIISKAPQDPCTKIHLRKLWEIALLRIFSEFLAGEVFGERS